MALVHNRGIFLRLEDAGAGPGNTREVLDIRSVAATGRPSVTTVGFANSVSAVAIGVATLVGNTGQARSVTNRSRRYWVTIIGTFGGVAMQIPVAPMQTVFLPATFVGTTATVQANSTWPLPAAALAMPSQLTLAGSTYNLTFDVVVEA